MMSPASQLENIPWWDKNILRGGGANERLGGQKYTKHKISNNSENFRGSKIAARGGVRSPHGPP